MSRITGAVRDKVGSMSTRMRYLFLFATVLGGSFLIISINTISDIAYISSGVIPWSSIRYKEVESYTEQSYTINTEGCVIPALKPLGEEIKQFVKYPTKIKPCPDSQLSLLANNKTHIWVRPENKEYYNISLYKTFTCCYKSFYRPLSVKDVTSFDIDERVNYSDCKYFSQIIEVNDEFVSAYCEADGRKIYHQYYLFAHKKSFVPLSSWVPSQNKTSYSVIIMGVDAVSRLNFHRTMPRTLAMLKKKGAVELLGYNKVGDNTFPNLIPMLMGKSVTELKTSCTPNEKATFDNCPFIWEWYKEAGYYTAFGEDSSSLGTFNYEKAGFIRTPTDYYIHTFINEAENNVGMNKDLNSFLCMNDKYFFDVLLEYIENLTLTLKSSKFFGLFWEVTMSHDYANYPMLMDKHYADFFNRLDASNYLEEAIIILVSDHGIRWGEFRSTNQGRLEERLPFVYVLTPKNFREKYNTAFNNLQLNSRRLTTPYDLHATLIDLINLEGIENSVIDRRSNKTTSKSQAYSLFLPIPENRTCFQAHIDDHWCTCHKGHFLSPYSVKALGIAEKLVQSINMLLIEYTQCAQLKLSELLEITEMEVNSPEDDKIEWREYMIMIKTTPGEGVFEGTLRYDGHKWGIAGTVSRLNLYGNQSRCVHNYLLKLYCYCNS
ncbi:unnamed protein product, partial [Brenthis ino]